MLQGLRVISTELKQSFPFLEPSSLHHAFSTLLIASLAYIFLYWQPVPEAQWLILSSILLSQAGLRDELNWQSAWKLLYYPVCGLLSALAVLLVSLCPFWLYRAFLVFILVFSAGFLGWSNRHYFFASFVLSLLAIIAAFSPTNFELALQRFSLILFGSFLIFIIRLPFFLYQRPRNFFYTKVIFFQKLKQVYQLIFYTSGQPTYLVSRELEESHFQIAWSDCLSAMQLLKTKALRSYTDDLDRIWDLTLSLGSLRYRLSDYTVLTMSQDEMQAILDAIISILDELSRAKSQAVISNSFDLFQTAIQRFEELYQSMLQTLANEPLVLLLFIQDLYALKEQLEKMILSHAGEGGNSFRSGKGGKHEKMA